MSSGDSTTSGVTCYGGSLAHVCITTPSSMRHVTSPNDTIDTDSTTACLPLQSGSTIDACVIAGTSVAVDSTAKLRATGSRPLVIVSTSTIQMDGTLDVASHRGGTNGAGADASACVAGTAAMFLNSGGGGCGGSFGTKGGNGGDGEQGVGGVASAAITGVTTLRGGCPGLPGSATGAGAGGHGGGAIYLVASQSITIAGTINASGAGADGATNNDSGGGGGGSGGMIGLEAPSVIATSGAKIFANGGGGGEGYEASNGDFGDDPTAPSPAANGGSGGSSNGGNGGDGSQTGNGGNGSNGNSSGGGGGGGGGGAGVIVVSPAQTLGGSVQPPPR